MHDLKQSPTATRRLRSQGVLVAVVSLLFVLLGIALGDRIPWYATAFFVVCCLAGIVSIFLEPPDPRSAEHLTIDDVGITRLAPNLREHVAWADLQRVRILTNDRGPWLDDVFFVLDAQDGTGCVVAHDLAVRAGLLEALQSRLTGVDDGTVIEAMGSTGNREFTIWEAKSTA